MYGVTHLSFGAVVGCIAGQCLGYPFVGAVVGGIASIIPDIDHPYSLIGKLFRPLSSWIYSEFDHRGCIHTIWFCMFISILAVIVSRSFFSLSLIMIFTCMLSGALSHLLLDSFNFTGVRPFLPLVLRGKWIQLNEFKGTIRSGDSIEGLIIIVCMIGLFIRFYYM